eukprot:CAMPEP_0206474398 /NCGR_PEP_ID=MMETSP0324_2-20121206/33464_1 /ASSEMBLY_ACC=CAM_ASM_000836 /TAXON_ID=2866 /ORGANISM="Crypthecodinium cohnii, Strain Seligo" /LENGTH=940 /DNA_ID=CAMNT_0053949565 /DNA_START=1 /DNA_END=2823 /DNA_ORIENTATION=-
MAEAVVVGVRVRPYNAREIGLNATCCIDMQGASTIITNAAGTPQTFAFDQSFWSHDGFKTEDDGYCSPIPGGRYADQRYVFETFGQRVLDNAWAGYHCCLFAYGQTGAGKSYSMVGYGQNKGIVPISCEEIFNRVGSNEDPNKRYEICLSMVEIYNETVQDLFIPFDTRPKNGFQIRESKALGIYVDGIVKNAVDSYPAIERAIDQGTANRSVGATQMNATSSRAHTVITIEFKQVEKMGGVENVKVSNINLIDLAGSEKAGQTGATGDRLKEGSAINKSLSALGNVIEKLAEKSQNPKGKKEVLIPYRESKLTRLLQNALGGSSKTIMICALSPASSNYEETLSTLRYADRAKKIKNAAVVNENPQEKLMREMREENAKLKAMLEAAGGGGDGSGGGGSGGISSEEVKAQQEQIEQLEQALQESQKSFQTRLDEARTREAEHQSRQTLRGGNVGFGNPMMVNLNAEMQLAGKLRFEFQEGKVYIVGGTMSGGGGGSTSSSSHSSDDEDSASDSKSSSSSESDEEERPGIQLSSPGVQAKHAKIINESRKCYLSIFGEAGKATWINGISVDELLKKRAEKDEANEPPSDEDDEDTPVGSILLRHCDRLVFGKAIFLFVDPHRGIAEMLIMSGIYSYAKARKELPASWKGTIKEGGGNRLKTMMASIGKAIMAADIGGKRSSVSGDKGSKDGGDDSDEEAGPPGSRRGGGSDDEADAAPYPSHHDDDSDNASSLGDGATKDEVENARLKDLIGAKDSEIEELKRQLADAKLEIQAKNKEIQRLREALNTGFYSPAPDEELASMAFNFGGAEGAAGGAAAGEGSERGGEAGGGEGGGGGGGGGTPGSAGGGALPGSVPGGGAVRMGRPGHPGAGEIVRPRFHLTQGGVDLASLRGQISTSRQIFNDKVNTLDETFKEALLALDSTRNGLTKAVAAWEAAKRT